VSDTPLTDAYRDKVSAIEITKHPLREFGDLLDFARRMEEQLSALKRGEFICCKCGLRKDAEHVDADF
jgi:hypothetical protein